MYQTCRIKIMITNPDNHQPDAQPTPGKPMGPKSTYRLTRVTPTDKKTSEWLEPKGIYIPKEPDNFKAFRNGNRIGSSPFRDAVESIISAPPSKNKKRLIDTYPEVDEGVLRCWGMRLVEVGGVQVIGWEVGMGKA